MDRTMTAPSGQQTRLLDVGEAAAYLNTSKRHIRRLRAESRLAYVKVGAKLRFRREDLDAYVAANTHKPADNHIKVGQ